ncbi:GDP-mannose transporter into the lumen of the Golgi [Marasmius tenuissimus]|uniref:GDP-mannose transporter n=1 Tax=Marasmius tenuissimus TaxID=585030 RepID=A0ABR3A191_9AGAR
MASTSRKPSEDAAEVKKALATGAGVNADQPVSISAVAPVVCYCIASIVMTLVNKVQPISNIRRLEKMGIISFRAFSWKDVKAWWPISFMLVMVIYTGSKSLQFLSIPVYTIFKNLTIILIAYGEVLWFGGRVTGLTFVSFVLMVFSSVIAAWSDVTNALSDNSPISGSHGGLTSLQDVTDVMHKLNIGYFWMLVNCLTSAAYVLTMRKRIKATGFTDWDSMFYSNLLSIPILAVFSFVAEDWGTENLNRNFPEETRNFLLFAIAFSGAAAVGISYTTAWCIRVTSSTTYSMVGALNKLPVAASGMLFFGDPVTTGSVSAVTVGFVAGVLYAVAKNNQKKAESRMQADAIIPLTARKP